MHNKYNLLRQRTIALWLVICLSIIPMIVPIFATLSANQGAQEVTEGNVLANDSATARPLKAEVMDNHGLAPAGLDAPGWSMRSASDVLLALLAVLGIAHLGLRFTLRHHVQHIK